MVLLIKFAERKDYWMNLVDIIGVFRGQKSERWGRKIFGIIMARKFPNDKS